MSGDEKLQHYETLFPRQDRLDLGAGADTAANPARDELKAAIGGIEIDFRQPPAVRLAAERIYGIADIEGRREALAAVPAAFRETVRLLVERAFYNRGSGKQ